MSHHSGILIAAACLFAAAPAAAQDWALDIQPAECTLSRATLEPAPLLISLWTRAGSHYHTLVVANRDMPDLRGKSVPVTVQFGEGSPALKGGGGAFPVRAEAGRGITVRGLGTDFPDAFAKASTIRITVGSKTYGPYAIPKAGGAIRAFKRCVGDQLVEWGADPAQFAPGGKPAIPLGSPDDWITGPQLINIAESGDTFHAVFRLSVSPEGVVDGCARIDDAKDRGAEKRGCAAVMNRKLATPASDAQGKPVRGVLTFEIAMFRRAERR